MALATNVCSGTMGSRTSEWPGAASTAPAVAEHDRSVIDMAERTCSVDGCSAAHLARDLCAKHYARWRTHGDPTRDTRAERAARTCSIPGCDRPHKGRGYCVMHLHRVRVHGDPNVRLTRYREYRWVSAKGYVMRWAPHHPMAGKSGYAAEHRMVAWDAGLLTDPCYVVHHLNGDRADNRLENLQVLEARQHDQLTASERERDSLGRLVRGGDR